MILNGNNATQPGTASAKDQYEDETVIVFIHLSLHKILFIVSTLKEISRMVSPTGWSVRVWVLGV